MPKMDFHLIGKFYYVFQLRFEQPISALPLIKKIVQTVALSLLQISRTISGTECTITQIICICLYKKPHFPKVLGESLYRDQRDRELPNVPNTVLD